MRQATPERLLEQPVQLPFPLPVVAMKKDKECCKKYKKGKRCKKCPGRKRDE